MRAVHDYGAGASLEIERESAAPLLVPFTHACVPDIDLPAGHLTVAPPAEDARRCPRAASPLAGEGRGEAGRRPEHPLDRSAAA